MGRFHKTTSRSLVAPNADSLGNLFVNQTGSWTDTANQGTSGSTQWPVLPYVSQVANYTGSYVHLTSSTNVQMIAQPGAGKSLYVTGIYYANTGSTEGNLTLSGSNIFFRTSVAALANANNAFGVGFPSPFPLPANTAISGSMSTGSVEVTLTAFIV